MSIRRSAISIQTQATAMDRDQSLVPAERIERAILLIRGQKVMLMLDRDLAALYGVSTKVLNQAVKRNARRFPDDFMFQLSADEFEKWRSQIVTSNPGAKMGLRRRPFAFTEQGVAMLSSVLNSDRAIDVNIAIMRAFVRLREILATNKDLARKLQSLEQRYDEQFRAVFEAIRLNACWSKPHQLPVSASAGPANTSRTSARPPAAGRH